MGLLLFVARLLMGLVFVISGIFKALNLEAFQQQMLYGLNATADAITETTPIVLPLVEADMGFYLALAVVAVEVIGGLLVIVGRPDILSRLAGLILCVFALATAVFYHNFWAVEDAAKQQLEMSIFLKDIALAGAMLLLALRGPNAEE